MIDLVENTEKRIGDYERMVTIDDNQSIFEGYEQDFILNRINPRVIRKINNLSYQEKKDLQTYSVLYR